jgi:SAM-dependent methyltransferase
VSRASTAATNGPRWGARARDWSAFAAPASAPAWQAVADAVGIDSGTRVLDIGCGSGEFCRLVVARGGSASGIDAAEGMIAVARGVAPEADLRVGAMETLPWEDDGFDVVTGFNSFQFAADTVAALGEARRVVRPAGQVAICNWTRPDESELFTITDAIRERQPPQHTPQPPPSVGEPGVVADLARRAGLEPGAATQVRVPFDAPDEETFVRALLSSGGAAAAIDHSGEDAVRAAIVEAARPFRRGDGSYHLDNRFTYLIAVPR